MHRKQPRKTSVPDARLLAMFDSGGDRRFVEPMESTRSASYQTADATFSPHGPPHRTNSVACQSSMSAVHFGLCELLFVRPPGGVVTPEQAYERRLLQQQFDYRQIDLITDERYSRIQLYSQRDDVLVLMRTMFTESMPRPTERQRSREDEAQRDGGSSDAAAITHRVEALQHVARLERVIPRQADIDVVPSSDLHSASLSAAQRSPTYREMERFADFVEAQISDVCDREAALLIQLEAQARSLLYVQFRNVQGDIELRASQRVLVMPPFQGFRPKIPVEHSLQPEEYLRRSLVARTFEHFQASFVSLQELENVQRNALADTALREMETAWSVMMHPHLSESVAQLQRRVKRLSAEKDDILRRVAELALADKLRFVTEAELASRRLIIDVRDEDLGMIRGIASRLESVAKLAWRNMDLQRTIERQAERHKRETAVLITAIDDVASTPPAAHPPPLPLPVRLAYAKATSNGPSSPAAVPLARLAPNSLKPAPVRVSRRSSKDGTPFSSVIPPRAPSQRNWRQTSARSYALQLDNGNGESDRPEAEASHHRNTTPSYFSGNVC